MSRRCIVNYACPGRENYLSGQGRLLASIRKYEPQQDILFYTVNLPSGCPSHQESPYAFKYFCMQEAFNRGFESVLWLDASVLLCGSIEPFWQVIETRGFLIFENGWSQADYTTETCLNVIGSSIAEADKQIQISGGMVGFNKDNLLAMCVFDKMLTWAKQRIPFHGGDQKSSHPTFKAHRHDQSCLTHLVYQYGLKLEPQGWVRYDWDTRDFNAPKLAEIRGM